MRLSVGLTCAAVFTVSWDRLLNIAWGEQNLKLPIILFLVASVLCICDELKAPRVTSGPDLPKRYPSWLQLLCIAVGFMMLRSVYARDATAAWVESLTIVVSVLLPAAVVSYIAFGRNEILSLLRAWVWGSYVAAGFGIYQLFAFYAGFPQLIEYRATLGGLGRISSFSYEAGYFGYFLVLSMGAHLARKKIFGEGSMVGFVLLVATLALANSRATFLILPIAIVWTFGLPRLEQLSRAVVPVIAFGMAVSAACLALPSTFVGLQSRFVSIFDETESTSNAPRLDGYRDLLQLVFDNVWFGVGPANIYAEASRYGIGVGVQANANNSVANNAVLQALADGGLILLGLQLGAVYLIWRHVRQFRGTPAWPLLTSWASGFVVACSVASFFWDQKFWVAVALGLAAGRVSQDAYREPVIMRGRVRHRGDAEAPQV